MILLDALQDGTHIENSDRHAPKPFPLQRPLQLDTPCIETGHLYCLSSREKVATARIELSEPFFRS
jgi:hypothetical protein